MNASRDRDDDDDDRYLRDARTPELAVVAERQRDILRRLRKLEDKQSEVDTLMNRGLGGIALLVGAGAFIGWMIALGGNVMQLFK